MMCGKRQKQSTPKLRRRLQTLALVMGIACASGAPSALAQLLAQTRPDAGQILEQQRERVPVTPRSDREVLPQEEQQPRPALRGTSTLKVTVKQFKISGNRIYSEAELLTAVADQYGKVLDFDGLNDAATAVRAYYRARGYFLAQAYLPAQQIRDGVVEIAVLEGRVGIVELKLAPGARLRPEFARGVLEEHLKTGDPITETGLERPLLLLSDLPNVVVSSEIGPSTKSIGAADLRVNVKESASGTLSGYADLVNSGNRFTGEWNLGISLNGNNLTGFGDQVAFRATMSDERMLFARAAWTVPVGYNGARVGLSYSEFDYRLAKDFAALEGHGEGGVLTAFGLYPFVRTRNANLIAQASYETKTLKDRVDTTNIVDDRRINTFKLGLVGDVRDRIFGGALNSFSVSYTDGDLSLLTPSVLASDQSARGLFTNGKFAKTNFDARRLQLISENVNMLLALSGQLANKNLSSAERMSLGGANGVRGYPTGEGVGDTGFLFTTELRYLPPKFQIWSGDVTFSGFYDAGRVKVNVLPIPGTTPNFRGLSSYGLGVSVGKDNDFLLKTSLAWRGENETPVADSARREPHVWVQAIKWF